MGRHPQTFTSAKVVVVTYSVSRLQSAARQAASICFLALRR
jgi:hypothetical protein